MTIAQVEKENKLNIRKITWGDLTWINIVPPTEEETRYLGENFHFHPLDLDDCLSRIQRPKIDEYEDYLFVVLHFPLFNRQTRVSYRGQFSAFIGKDYLITLHKGELKALVNLFNECEISEKAREENFSHGSAYLLYRAIDKGVDSYFPILDKILRLMDDMEDSVFDEEVEAGKELAVLRRDVITQRRIFWPMRSMLASLENKLRKYAKIDLTVHYGDLMDHVNMICETIDECREVIEVFKDTDYLLSNYRLNRTTRILAIVSAIVLPFLVISSMYGMNVILPGGIEKEDSLTFIFLVILMLVIAGTMLFIFKRKRLI